MARLLVPDASIIVKWSLPLAGEADTHAAHACLEEWQAGEIDLLAPSLWRYEAANVLARKAPRQAQGLLAGLLDLDLPTVEVEDDLLGEALSIALRLSGVTVYDAAYHALALRVRGTFLTADVRYHRRAKRLGAIELLTP